MLTAELTIAGGHDNRPYIVPTYFAYGLDHIYAFATIGQKIEWMRLNPLVCGKGDEMQSEEDWASVVVRGRCEELLEKPEYYSETRRKAQASLEKRFLWGQEGFAAARTRQELSRNIPVFYCIHIEEITGHRASVGSR